MKPEGLTKGNGKQGEPSAGKNNLFLQVFYKQV